MPTVSAGTTATYTFPLTQTVTISPDSNESAAVTVTRGGVIIFSGAITSGQSIGPYIAGDVLTVTAQRGAVDYTVESVPAAVPGAGISSVAPIEFLDQAATQAGAPVVTKTGTTAPVGLTLYSEGDPVFDYLGVGLWITNSGDSVMRRPAIGTSYARVNWQTDEPETTLRVLNFNCNFQLFYDEFDGLGWKYAGLITTTSAGTREFVTVVFATRRPRRFSLRGFNFNFGGVYCPATGILVRDTIAPELPIMAVTGDSYSQGTGAAGQAVTWAAAFCQSLGYEFFGDGIGSTGWASASPNTPMDRYPLRGPGALVRRNSGVETPVSVAKACYALGYNDSVGSVPVMQAAIAATIALCDVKPFLIGPWTPVGDTADLTTKAAAIAASAALAGCQFVSAQGIVTSVNKSSLTGGDNVHPTQYGHNYIGQILAARARAVGVA